MNETNKKIHTYAMWSSFSNLIMPISVAISIGLKGLLLLIQDSCPLILNQKTISLVVFLPIICVLLSWIFPFIVLRTNQHKHPFIEETAKNSFFFTLTISLCISLLLPVISLPIALSISSKSLNVDFIIYLFIALLIFHFFAIVIGSLRAAKGKIYKYPFAFNRTIASIFSVIMIFVYICLSPLLIYFKGNDSDVQRLGQIPFNSTKWQDESSAKWDSPIREKMLGNLFRNYHFEGKSREEVLTILGKPQEPGGLGKKYQEDKDRDLVYRLSTFAELDVAETRYLVFKLNDQQVVTQHKIINLYTGL
jgi:uncharacterized Tic20 family protein